MTIEAAARLRITQNGMAHASEIVSQVGSLGMRYGEVPVHILYTEYSKSKGQSLINSVNILFDLVFR
jgi:polyprenyl-phospho-N-acetylgalactosaminyl synthase